MDEWIWFGKNVFVLIMWKNDNWKFHLLYGVIVGGKTKHNKDVIKGLHKHHQLLLPLLKVSCKSLLKRCDQRVFGS